MYCDLRYATFDEKDNDEFMKNVIQYSGEKLKYASKRLRDNYKIVKKAVKNDGYALEYASKRLRSWRNRKNNS